MNKDLSKYNHTNVAFKYRKSVVLIDDGTSPEPANSNVIASLVSEMMHLGFIPTEKLLQVLLKKPEQSIIYLYNNLIPVLAESKGADVEYKPMYPNFPKQVMEASDVELFVNAIMHYWSAGQWLPEYEKIQREYKFEKINPIKIGVIDVHEFDNIFTDILRSSDSISATDKEVVEWFLNNNSSTITLPDPIPFKENMCIVAAMFVGNGLDIKPFVTNATDVLRIATHISGGDVSLAENTKFVSFRRKFRRTLVYALAPVITIEDIQRHSRKWNKLFHSLHVGEYNTKVRNIAKQFRDGDKINTFNSKLEKFLHEKNIIAAVNLLSNRPGDFARRLMHILSLVPQNTPKTCETQQSILSAFFYTANKVSTRVLLQLLGYSKTRATRTKERVAFPKGNTQKVRIISTDIPQMDTTVLSMLKLGIQEVLMQRFTEMPTLGKVYLDPNLKDCPIPTQQRSASEGLFSVARGTNLPFTDKGVLRFFIYWIGQDIDLSATFHDDKFNFADHISYQKTRNAKCAHSGDITNAPAPNGASEFIDIDIDWALEQGHRYVTMNVLVYGGPSFKAHEKCYAGWMTRDEVDSNEIYEPKTVEQKVDLTGDTRNQIPMVFDLLKRKAIWMDLATSSYDSLSNRRSDYHAGHYSGNNVTTNAGSIQDTIKSVLFFKNKVSLYDLFKFHAVTRGTLVDNPEDADVSYGFGGDVTPYDITTINAEYITD